MKLAPFLAALLLATPAFAADPAPAAPKPTVESLTKERDDLKAQVALQQKQLNLVMQQRNAARSEADNGAVIIATMQPEAKK